MNIIGYITKEIIKWHNPNWLKISYHPYRLSITEVSGSEKTKASFNLIRPDVDTDKIHIYTKDPYEGFKNSGIKHFNDLKAFGEYSNNLDGSYKSIE